MLKRIFCFWILRVFFFKLLFQVRNTIFILKNALFLWVKYSDIQDFSDHPLGKADKLTIFIHKRGCYNQTAEIRLQLFSESVSVWEQFAVPANITHLCPVALSTLTIPPHHVQTYKFLCTSSHLHSACRFEKEFWSLHFLGRAVVLIDGSLQLNLLSA